MSYYECIDRSDSPCEGEVFERLALSGSGMRFARCDGHYAAYCERLQPVIDDINERYPQQAPADFDPYYAGECWDEED